MVRHEELRRYAAKTGNTTTETQPTDAATSLRHASRVKALSWPSKASRAAGEALEIAIANRVHEIAHELALFGDDTERIEKLGHARVVLPNSASSGAP